MPNGINKKRVAGRDLPAVPEVEMWEQQPEETFGAWEAFYTYREMGPLRTHARVAAKLGKVSKAQIDDWSSRWAWRDRVRAWNIHIDRQIQEARSEMIREMRDRHAKLGRKLLDKFMERVDSLDPSDIPPGSLDRMLKAGAEIERSAVGEPTLVVEHKADAGVAAIAERMKNPTVRNMLDDLASLMESDSETLQDFNEMVDASYTVLHDRDEDAT